VSLQKLEAPRLWIVAGPNGSGKSTLYDATDIEGFGRSVWIINPDILTARLHTQERLPLDKANGEALNRIQAWLDASIQAHQTVGVETVLSTPKYRVLVEQAKARGFEIRLLYVTLRNANLNVQRVRLRVATGGHSVPEDKIRSRRERSFQQLPWFLDQADVALIYDNSGVSPVLVGHKHDDSIQLDPRAPREIKVAVESIRDKS
jgi:predicted ABC-type ATPase